MGYGTSLNEFNSGRTFLRDLVWRKTWQTEDTCKCKFIHEVLLGAICLPLSSALKKLLADHRDLGVGCERDFWGGHLQTRGIYYCFYFFPMTIYNGSQVRTDFHTEMKHFPKLLGRLI